MPPTTAAPAAHSLDQKPYAERVTRRREVSARIPKNQDAQRALRDTLARISEHVKARQAECAIEGLSFQADPQYQELVAEEQALRGELDAHVAEAEALRTADDSLRKSLYASDERREREAEKWLQTKYKNHSLEEAQRAAQQALVQFLLTTAWGKDTTAPEVLAADLMGFIQVRLDLDAVYKQLSAAITTERNEARATVCRRDPTLG